MNVNRLVFLFIFLTFLCIDQAANAQISVNPTDDNFVQDKDKEKHAEWKEGKSQFPGRPRDWWQLGIGGGSFLISGDVKPAFGWGASVHLRKSIGYVFSLKLEYMFGQASGINYAASNLFAFPNVDPFTITSSAGNIIQPGQYGPNDAFYANYKIDQHHAISLQTVYNLNNIKFHKKSNKWSLNLIVGLGANLYNTKINALDANGQPYNVQMTDLANRTGAGQFDLTKLNDRDAVLQEVRSFLDDSYETLAQQNANNILNFGEGNDRYVVNPFVNVGLSLEFLVTPRVSLALEHQAFISDDDFFDGKSRKENGSRTSNVDIPHYTSIRIGFHLGKKDKAIQPLWFINPLIYPMKDIADLKEKLDDDWFLDSDDDGVPDALDEEKDTPPGIAVDAKGRSLDSDGDGVVDTEDKEPFSPPGYEVNEEGIADVPRPIYPEDVSIIPGDEDGEKQPKLIIGDKTYEPNAGGGMKDWYLPMVHFDLDKYYLRTEAYEQLQHVANVMLAYPNIKVVAHGHTDVRHSFEYNDMLSYNRAMTCVDYIVNRYGIDRSRFIVKYNGEVKNLIENAKTEPEHFMNRRTEFYIADDDQEQSRPPGDGGMNRKWKY
jgi:outer membrane protein OmpA-like peptidoglycan-associated protein